MERLQKIISARGVTSRRNAEKLIVEGKVKVNGVVITELGFKTSPDADIEVNGKQTTKNNEKFYYLFNKPRLVLTTMYDPKQRKTVADYFKDVPTRVYPVGRLDYDVSGLIIMTNDGEFANFVMHPRYEFFKTYQGLCKGKVSKQQVNQLLKGVKIEDDYFTKAIQAELLNYDQEKDQSIIEMTIAEGKKHHVKQMFSAIEANLMKLKRTKIEFLEVDDLEVGRYRELKPHEVKKFYGIYQSTKRKEDLKIK
ncbi:ribosomal large subunit pseudouridine synthase B [Mesoplasma entomophilum]|uniref:Pseudouridine synthase n=1 Tax=Mesoplasma entomophilum TaxID=2149 RepID=A0A3S5XZN7_9MOLU|nr:pseudouridine synthase [Mesoplasma entomophilum]ATQ35728.1 pseudouridine synthase [Mesoplasma entomophilum]ATZ19697.1 ribosomal large subunit pseudouridine synthase B [Mesoplasma entomophilum]